MGIFSIFKKDPSDTARIMAQAYKNAISSGYYPKDGLVSAFNAIKNKNDYLKDMPSAQWYFNGIFKEEYINLSNDPDEAKDFVIVAIMNLIEAYLHPEISSLTETFDDMISGETELKRKKIRNQISDLI